MLSLSIITIITLPGVLCALGLMCAYLQKHGGYSVLWRTIASYAGFVAFFAAGWFLVDAFRVFGAFL